MINQPGSGITRGKKAIFRGNPLSGHMIVRVV